MWYLPKKHCLKLGGNLASVHSLSEYQFLQKLTGDPLSWIGGHDAVEEGQWLWSDGSVFSYEKWSYPQPDNYGGDEHCLCCNAGGTKDWNDCPCSHTLPFVCALKRQ
ncbi:ladderlectin-like [Megalops cyprinoides]|uniref:ladderlectin-like n=1 Tax=Megalops cyprinoides TaxID=118141 RepID=UPI0018649BFD|nr:ladderlectin-like [Megalops cyprinoides]